MTAINHTPTIMSGATHTLAFYHLYLPHLRNITLCAINLHAYFICFSECLYILQHFISDNVITLVTLFFHCMLTSLVKIHV